MNPVNSQLEQRQLDARPHARRRTQRWTNVLQTLLAAVAFSGSLSCATALQRTLPVAVANHHSALSHGGRAVSISVPLSYNNLWNATGRVLDQRGGVLQEDGRGGRISSGWNYETDASSGTEAVQVRRRFSVEIPTGATEVGQLRVHVESARRTRRPGEAPSAWNPEPTDGEERWIRALLAQINQSAGASLSMPADRVVWQGRPAEVIRRIATRLTPYDVAQSDDSTLVTEWRVTQEAMDNDVLAVRSRLRVIVEANGAGSTVSVRGQAQYLVQRSGNQNAAQITAWTDLDPSEVVGHGWSIVQQALQPVPMPLREEALASFARPAGPEPELPDPRERWAQRGNERPRGVHATSEGGTSVVPWFGPENATTLVGRAFTADMQPAGQVRPLGQLRTTATSDSGSLTTMLAIDAYASLSAGYFAFSGGVSNRTNSRVVVHEAYVENQRVEMPEFGDFSSLPETARYYVAAVTVGRAAMVGFQGDFSGADFNAGIDYGVFSLGLRTGSQRQSVSCRTRLRGSSAQVAGFTCSQSNAPSPEIVEQAARSGEANESAITRVWLRRVPDSVIGVVRPSRIWLTHLRADQSACSDPLGEPPELEYTVSFGGAASARTTCPRDSYTCNMAVEVPVGSSASLTVFDRDVFQDDPCGSIAIDQHEWMVPTLSNRAPGTTTGRVQQGGLTVEYRVEY